MQRIERISDYRKYKLVYSSKRRIYKYVVRVLTTGHIFQNEIPTPHTIQLLCTVLHGAVNNHSTYIAVHQNNERVACTKQMIMVNRERASENRRSVLYCVVSWRIPRLLNSKIFCTCQRPIIFIQPTKTRLQHETKSMNILTFFSPPSLWLTRGCTLPLLYSAK
jgi:hypothetical protein